MRRKVYVLLAVLTAAGVLSACSANNGNEERGKENTHANDMVEISQKESIVKAAGDQGVSTVKNQQTETETETETSQGMTMLYAEINQLEMVMLDGELYYNSGRESDIKGRCGMMDGSIDSTVQPGEIPKKDNQSNFGKGYGFQWVGDGSVDVFMNDLWIRFEKQQTKKANDKKQDESQSSQTNKINQTNTSKWDKTTLTKSGELKPHGISIQIKERTGDYITAVLTNTTKKDMYYGEYFKVQVKLDGEWYDLPVDLAFRDLAHELLAGAKAEETYALTAYGTLPAGTYRLVVEEASDEFQVK